MNVELQVRLEAIGAAMLGAGIPFLIEAFSDDKVTKGELVHTGFLMLTGGLITLLAYLRSKPKTVEQAEKALDKAVVRELTASIEAPLTREQALAQAKKD